MYFCLRLHMSLFTVCNRSSRLFCVVRREAEPGMALAKADELFNKKDWKAAIDAYRGCIAMDILTSDSERANAYFSLGYAYRQMRDDTLALEWYNKLIALGMSNPMTCSGLNNRGIIYQGRKEYGLALADFSRSIRELSTPGRSDFCRRADLFHEMKLQTLEIADLLAAASLKDGKDNTDIVARIETVHKSIAKSGVADADALAAKFKEIKDSHSAEMKVCITELKATRDTLKNTQDALAAVQKRMSELEKMCSQVTNDKLHRIGIMSDAGGSSDSGGSGGSASTINEPHPP